MLSSRRCKRRCAACGIEERKLRRCARCRTVSYCSVDCQRQHWPEHKQRCKQLWHVAKASNLGLVTEIIYLDHIDPKKKAAAAPS